MNEKRSAKRVQCFAIKREIGFEPVWHFSSENSNAIGTLLLDISPEGSSILVDKEVDTTGSLELEISTNLKGQKLFLRSEQMWCDIDYSVEHKRLGLRFIDLDEQSKKMLEEFMATIKSRENDIVRGNLFVTNESQQYSPEPVTD